MWRPLTCAAGAFVFCMLGLHPARVLFQVLPFPGPGGAASAGGGGPAGGKYRSLTVPAGAVSADLTNFVIPVRLALGAGKIASPSCYDVLFAADSGATNKYKWYIETCDQAGGNVVAHVQYAGTLRAAADNVLYTRYGDSSITTFQGGTGVWDGTYTGVWTFGDGASLDVNDRSANGNNAVHNGATAAAGVVGGAAALDGASHYIRVADTVSLHSLTYMTVEFWLYQSRMPEWTWILAKSGDGDSTSWGIYEDGGNYRPNFVNKGVQGSQGMFSQSTWTHIAMRIDGTALKGYINGATAYLGADTDTVGNNAALPLYLGGGASGRYLTGMIDHVVLSNVARPDAWVKADYDAQKSGSTFVTVGSEN